jgi:hypothetical protein
VGPRTRSSTRFPGRQERLGNANGAVCRCAGQDLIAVRGSALPPVPAGSYMLSRITGTHASCYYTACPASRRTATRSPRCCLARASREESTHQPLPLTPASIRNTSLPPAQAPTTAGDRGGDVTERHDAPNADSARKMNSYPWRYICVQIVQFGVSGNLAGRFGVAWLFTPCTAYGSGLQDRRLPNKGIRKARM